MNFLDYSETHQKEKHLPVHCRTSSRYMLVLSMKVRKGAKIKNRYNQVKHLTQDTNGKVTNSQIDTIDECEEASPFQAGDHKAHIIRRTQRHSKHKTEKT